MLLTTREVAELLRVHPKHVYRLMRRGLPAGRVGDEWRFDRDAVLAWSRARHLSEPQQGAPGEGTTTGGAGEGVAKQRGEDATAGRAAEGVTKHRGAAAGRATASERAAASEQAAVEQAEAPAHLAANGDVAIELLLEALWRGPGPWVGFVRADHGKGIELLRRRAVLLCGFHETNAMPGFDAALARLHVVEREVGIAFAPGRAPRDLAELGDASFATRPPSAGVRGHLEAALRRQGVDPSTFGRPAKAYASHQDVVLALARGKAEAGLTTAAWAARLGLAFRALATEPYALLLYAHDLDRPEVERLRTLLASKAMREAFEASTGYDASRAGELERSSPE